MLSFVSKWFINVLGEFQMDRENVSLRGPIRGRKFIPGTCEETLGKIIKQA